MLTNSELNQIKNFLALYGKKDNQLSRVNTVNNIDYIAIVQEGKNVTITVELLKRAVLEGIITDHTFDDLWDAIPTDGSDKMVRSNGIWHAINDADVIDEHQIKADAVTTPKIADGNVTYDKLSDEIHNQNEMFAITLSCSPTSLWITNNTNFTAQLTTTNKVKVYGDAGDSTVIPYNPTFTTTAGGSINPDTKVWTLAHTVGTQTATYKAKRNATGVEKTVTASILLYLSKFAGYASTNPIDITTLDLEDHSTTTATCILTIPAKSSGAGFMNIYIAVPTNMITSGYHIELTQPDALNAPIATTSSVVTRTINSDVYSYTLFKSVDTVDATANKRIEIKLVKN